MGAITVRRSVAGRMSGAVFALGVLAFVLAFFDPAFFPLAWASLIGGAILALALWIKHRRTSRPTVSHLAPDSDEKKPIQPR